MKKYISIVAIAAVAAGSAQAQNAASVVGRAIEVHTSARDAIYQMEAGGGTWEFMWSAPGQAKDVFDTYFEFTQAPENPNIGQSQQAMAEAFTQNSCNFWAGEPLEVVTYTHTQHGTWTATPKADFTGNSAPDAGTGWTLFEGENGEALPIEITIEDIFIAEQKVLHHRPKPRGNRPWNTKMSFDLLPEDIEDLKIEIVYEVLDPDGPEIAFVLFDALHPHELVSEYADWEFESSGLAWGNPEALAQVVNGALVSDILQGEVGPDDFAGNDGETGGLRVLVVADPPLTYTITEPGHYTLRISGKVRGNALDGTSDQEFQVTVNGVTVNLCDE